MYQFSKRNNLVIRTRTFVTQGRAPEMETMRLEFCRGVMRTYKNLIKNPMYLINMEETADYFNSPPTRTEYRKSEKTVPANIQGASLIITVAVSIAMNGTKLSLLLILKDKTEGSVKKVFFKHLPE